MKIAIVAGNHRREAESARVARYLEQELKKLGISETTRCRCRQSRRCGTKTFGRETRSGRRCGGRFRRN